MGRIWGCLAVLIGLTLCSPAWAITVEVVKGNVSVRQGDGFRRVVGPTEVYFGDKVMTAPDGQAKIVYPNGCVVPVGPGGIATVGECTKPMTAGLETPVEETRPPYLLYGAIAAGIGVGICAASGCFRDDDNPPPRSP